MGADTPAEGGDQKPTIKVEGKPHLGGRGNSNRRANNTIRNKNFLGADTNLRGHTFEAKRNGSEQVANFTTVDEIIKAQLGVECDPYVLEPLEKESLVLPDEPMSVYKRKESEDNPDEMTELEK